MAERKNDTPDETSRVDRKSANLAESTESAKELAAKVAGTASETAELFSGGTRPTTDVIREGD